MSNKKKAIVRMGRYMGQVDGEVVPPLIVSKTTEIYHGREVIFFKQVPSLFGTRKEGQERIRKLTIHNGILNQCALTEPPTPYWAILDAASDLKSDFTRNQVIELALKTFGNVVHEADKTACEMAWDVLRNHHRHARKCNAGMAYMIESNNGKLSIRARCPDETIQYFSSEKERKKMSREMMAAEKKLKNVEKEPEVETPTEIK
jgi:hypothetical protein